MKGAREGRPPIHIPGYATGLGFHYDAVHKGKHNFPGYFKAR